MEVGVSTASLFMRADTKGSLKILSELDARVVEVFLESFSEYDERFVSSLSEYTKGLVVHSLHTVTTQFEPQLFSSVPVQKKDAFAFIEGICRGAKTLGAKNYTLHGRARVKKNAKLESFDEYALHFNELCDLLSGYGMSLTLENVEWAFCSRPEWFFEIKKRCPELKACFDIKQARISGYDPFDYIEAMKGRINTFHASDVDENGKMCLPGRGVTDFGKVFYALKRAGFCGNTLIEVYTGDYGDVSEIAESLRYLRKIKEEVF